ncbi:type A chloramphenicol O-acetyltransferase [Glutamicibacter soli]
MAFIGATVFLGTGRLDGMSNLIPFDVDKWSRREHFHHYRQVVPCTYSMCVELDATDFVEELRKTSWKTYIAQIWAIATIVNRHHEFRMALTEDGQLGVWGEVHPSFTIFNRVQETFSSVWVPYDTDFSLFHAAAASAIREYSGGTTLFPQGSPPSNLFDISSIPWASFTGFNLNVVGVTDHFAPIFTLGRYIEKHGQTILPLAVQVHHAVVDGFHVARLVDELQALIRDSRWLH